MNDGAGTGDVPREDVPREDMPREDVPSGRAGRAGRAVGREGRRAGAGRRRGAGRAERAGSSARGGSAAPGGAAPPARPAAPAAAEGPAAEGPAPAGAGGPHPGPGGRPRAGGDPLPLLDLRADCANCLGLCCVTLPFSASTAFALDKRAGTPCRHLGDDLRCGIHHRLRDEGFGGCVVFDCHGAGQKVSRHTFGGLDWRDDPATRRRMTEVFPVVRRLHELLRHLTEALTLPRARPLYPRLRTALARTEELSLGTPEQLLALDLGAHHAEVNSLLLRAADLERARVPGRRPSHRGADLMGARLAGADLRGASLRGALLIAADLTGAELTAADLTGADLRDARLHGADLSGALFVTQPQLTAALGNSATAIPAALDRPAHWDA